jgi:pyruvate,orthophosphate dikinase
MPIKTVEKPKARVSSAKRRTPARAPLKNRGKYVYFFGNGKADGNREMKDLLGGKGSGLAEMTNAGLPVPPGFTISTEVCNIYYREKGRIPANIEREIDDNVSQL